MDYERPSMEMMRKTYCQWVDRPWIKEKMKVGDCYGICMEFYEKFFDLNLRDYPNINRKALFMPEFIADQADRWEDGVIHVYEGDRDVPPPSLDDLMFGDMIVMKLYLNPLQGGYASKDGRMCNHSGIYLGHGYMLHHAWLDPSNIVDIKEVDSYLLRAVELVLRSPHVANYTNPI